MLYWMDHHDADSPSMAHLHHPEFMNWAVEKSTG